MIWEECMESIWIIIGLMLLPIIVYFIIYNSLIGKKNEVNNAFAGIDVQLKMRYDLIPNLISSVKTYMEHEKGLLEKITELRTQVMKPNLPADKLVKLDNEITSSLKSIMIAVENYPTLRASENFTVLQNSLGEVEAQISAARRSYNACVTDYNNAIEMFPSNIVARSMGYRHKEVFQIDTFWPLIQKIEELSGREYIESLEVTKSMRIIADHLRTATMIMGDDKCVAPSNVDRGYIVRRLIRRAVRHGRLLGINENFCDKIAAEVIKIFKDVYSEVAKNQEFIMFELAKEESKFRNTIEQGLKEFEKLLNGFRIAFEKTGKNITEISGKQAFKLFESYGFPLEMTLEMALENGLTVDVNSFEEAFKAHQDLSRAGAEQKFKGGLADHGEMSVKYHTGTHLLNAALRQVLGSHVEQRGSNITAERLRFDFSHPEKMSEEQKQKVEDLINYAIKKDYHVSFIEMTVAEAKTQGALGVFEDKYGNKVKVYSVGEPDVMPSATINSQTFSKEICGGPHVEHTGIMGTFKIVKEEAVSSGIRRIKAVLQ